MIGPDPDTPEQRKTFVTKEGIEAACLRENQARFTQACGSPLLTEPLYSAVGRIGLNDFTEHILHYGTFPPNFDDKGVHPAVHRLLPFLRKDPAVPDLDWPLDSGAYATSWKRMPATTSASPFGWTFAQVKALTLDPKLVAVPTVLAWAPFHYGFSPPPWQKTANVMLEKQTNNINVERLRAIALLDSLYNHNNKILAWRMMTNAESHNQVAREQYGSRKKKECIDQSINKVLTVDHWRTH